MGKNAIDVYHLIPEKGTLGWFMTAIVQGDGNQKVTGRCDFIPIFMEFNKENPRCILILKFKFLTLLETKCLQGFDL